MAEAKTRTMTVEEIYQWPLDQDERDELVEGVRAAPRDDGREQCARCDPGELHHRTGQSAPRQTLLGGERLHRSAHLHPQRPAARRDGGCAAPEKTSCEARRPTVVVEALSPSTRRIDRLIKLEEYRRHPGSRHILLIDPDSAKLYSRPDEGAWSDADMIGPEALVAPTAIDVVLPLGVLYERADLEG
jgi:hypothetical protein